MPMDFLGNKAKQELFALCDANAAYVPQLRKAIVEGRINGFTYTPHLKDGPCCLIGTLAILEGVQWVAVKENRQTSTLESYAMCILPNETPETNGAARNLVEWIDEWLASTAPKELTWQEIDARIKDLEKRMDAVSVGVDAYVKAVGELTTGGEK